MASNVTSNAILVTTPRQLQTRYFYTHCRDGKSSSGCWKPTFGEGKTCPSQKEKLWENSAALVMLNLPSHTAGCVPFKSPASALARGEQGNWCLWGYLVIPNCPTAQREGRARIQAQSRGLSSSSSTAKCPGHTVSTRDPQISLVPDPAPSPVRPMWGCAIKQDLL